MHSLTMSNLKPCASPLQQMQVQEETMEESPKKDEGRANLAVAASKEKVREENVDGGSDNDEGYHTPTSPSRKIPTAVECPPAPKRHGIQRRYKKRKLCCCLIEIKDVEFVFGSGETGTEVKRRKEVGEETET